MLSVHGSRTNCAQRLYTRSQTSPFPRVRLSSLVHFRVLFFHRISMTGTAWELLADGLLVS